MKRKNYRKKKTQIIIRESDKEVTNTGKARQQALIYRGIGIPSIFCTKLKYNFTQALNGTFLNIVNIRGNGAYDPEQAAGGGQPMYFDQFSALYQRYTVLSSSISCTFVNRAGVGEAAFTKVGVYPLGDLVAPLTLQEATEKDNCKYAQLGPNTGDQGIIQMNHYAKATQVLGKAKDENTDDTLSAGIGANPAREWFWIVFAGALDGTAAISLYLDITVTYYVKFYDRQDVSRS